MSQEHHKAYVLHHRKYTDTRVLVDFFTLTHGRVSGVFRVSKRNAAVLQPFQPVQVCWRGSHALKTITSCESASPSAATLEKKQLFCGLYLNELVQRLLPLDDSYEPVFAAYEQSLQVLSTLSEPHSIEPALRVFEFLLLRELGFEINLGVCIRSGEVISQHSTYTFQKGEGFTRSITSIAAHKNDLLVSGEDIINIANNHFNTVSTLRAAKRISREALAPLLGNKPLKSRELFL